MMSSAADTGHETTHHEEHRRELVKEASTMALYVAICLLAALTVADEADVHHRQAVIGVVWGTTLGLALAHWFAFRLSARLVSAGEVRRTDVEISLAQLAGSVIVAALATVPVLLFHGSEAEIDATRWVVLAFVAVVGYLVAKGGGATTVLAAAYSAAIVVSALVVVVVKNALSGH